MFNFIEKSEIDNLRVEAKEAKLIKGFEKYVNQLSLEGRFKTDIAAVMKASGIRSFSQNFVDYLHEKGFKCADTYEEMDMKLSDISWETAEGDNMAHDMHVLANNCIQQCLNNLKINIKDRIKYDPYISIFDVQENNFIPGARKVLKDMGYNIVRTGRTVNGCTIYEIEL